MDSVSQVGADRRASRIVSVFFRLCGSLGDRALPFLLVGRSLRAAIGVVACLAATLSIAETGEKPNILWIIAEDMSPDLGCYGNEAVTTPNIDWLAANGMTFNKVFTTGPACAPSRTAMAIGVYQTTIGAYHMRYSKELEPELPRPYRILPQLMRENGYYTGNIRDMGTIGTGKDDWLFKTSQKSWDTRSWNELVDNQPFFAQINLKESHRAFSRKAKTPVLEDAFDIPPYYPDHKVSREDWAGYLEDVNLADEHVGYILEKLKSDGLAENTIVCFLGDHGRPMIRAKNWLYDSGTRIPLVIYYPKGLDTPSRFQPNTENSELISAVDLTAETILMAGGELPDWMQGRSFLREDSRPRKYLFTAVDRIGDIDSRSRAVRTKRYKYIRNYKTPGSINECCTPYRKAMHSIHHLLNAMGERNLLNPVQEQLLIPIAREELYDLENDPFETINLAGNKEYESTRKKLASKLSMWIETSGDKGFQVDSDAIVQHFNKYGITSGAEWQAAIDKQKSIVDMQFE